MFSRNLRSLVSTSRTHAVWWTWARRARAWRKKACHSECLPPDGTFECYPLRILCFPKLVLKESSFNVSNLGDTLNGLHRFQNSSEFQSMQQKMCYRFLLCTIWIFFAEWQCSRKCAKSNQFRSGDARTYPIQENECETIFSSPTISEKWHTAKERCTFILSGGK